AAARLPSGDDLSGRGGSSQAAGSEDVVGRAGRAGFQQRGASGSPPEQPVRVQPGEISTRPPFATGAGPCATFCGDGAGELAGPGGLGGSPLAGRRIRSGGG